MQFRIDERQVLEGKVPADHERKEGQSQRQIQVTVVQERFAHEAPEEGEEGQRSLLRSV